MLLGNTTRAFNSSALVGDLAAGNAESSNSSGTTAGTTPASAASSPVSTSGSRPESSQESEAMYVLFFPLTDFRH